MSKCTSSSPVDFCPRPRPGLLLASGAATLPVPCGRRSCEVCGARLAREDAALLLEDARRDPPVAAIVLTTRRALTPRELAGAQASLWRRARRELGRVETCAFIHWTTGAGGARRRPHLHVAVKCDPAAVGALERIVRESWERSTGARDITVQEVGGTDVRAVIVYAAGGGTGGQAPPEAWSGRRMRASRSYWSEPIADLRARVRARAREQAVRRRVRVALEGVPEVSERVRRPLEEALVRAQIAKDWRVTRTA